MCLLFVLLLGGPRIAGVLWWLWAPGRWDLAFGTFLVPALGVALLPWTTIAWVAVAPGGIGLWGTLLIVAGLFVDLGAYVGGGGYRSRR
jgi:hypothetical protein